MKYYFTCLILALCLLLQGCIVASAVKGTVDVVTGVTKTAVDVVL